MTQIGVRNMLIGGSWTISLATSLFGMIEFIPHSSGGLFTAIGFTVRVIQGVGTAAVFNSSMTYLADVFPGAFVLV